MKDFRQLVREAQVVGRIPSPEEAERWVRAVASILADWSGEAGEGVRSSLPRELFHGRGSGGRSHEKTLSESARQGTSSALLDEAGRRAGQPDPGKVGVTLRPLLALLRDALPGAQAAALQEALPPAVGHHLQQATTTAPWAFRLLPQSYARPARTGPPH